MKLISVYGRQTRRPWGKVPPPYVQVALLGLKTVSEDSHAAWPQKEEDSQVDSLHSVECAKHTQLVLLVSECLYHTHPNAGILETECIMVCH